MPRYVRTRKSERGYRFDGLYGMGTDIASLRSDRALLITKIADPADPDDKSWVKDWLARVEAEIEKKEPRPRTKDARREDGSFHRSGAVPGIFGLDHTRPSARL